MKKYMMGLGAMLVGAGLMFVLMHGEVSAESRPEPFVCSMGAHVFDDYGKRIDARNDLVHCRVGRLDCAYSVRGGNVICPSSGGLFK